MKRERLDYPCPACGAGTKPYVTKAQRRGVFRYRRCVLTACDCRFSTIDTGNGEEFLGYPGRRGPATKKQQLAAEVETLRQQIMDLWLSVRVRAIWAKADFSANGPVILTRSAGYDLNGDNKTFFDD